MSILSDFEDRVASAVEGFFAGTFRSPVQPAEIAKALGRSMDDMRVVGVGRVYAPTSYGVAISPKDAERFGTFTTTLGGELASYLVSRAAESGYTLTSRPAVEFRVHDDLKMGQFRVRAEMVAEPEAPEEPLPPTGAVEEPLDRPPASPSPAFATLTLEGAHHDIALRGERMVVGRLATADIPLEDANVSRQHVAFVAEPDGSWAVEDLGSTNGTLLNGERLTARRRLSDGDVIQAGLTRIFYHAPGA